MSGNTVTKTSLSKRVRGLVAGTQKHIPTGPLTVGSATYEAPALVQLFQGLADALDATDAARARWQDALKNAADTRAKVGPIVSAYRAWVEAAYRGAPSLLADFGLAPPKVRTPLTAEQKAAAVAKREATRAARHTMGKVQKKSVKGTVVTTAPAAQPSVAAAPVALSSAAPPPAAGASGATGPHIP